MDWRRNGGLRGECLRDLIQRRQIRQGGQLMFLRGLDQIVGQDGNEIVVLLLELFVSQHCAQPLLGVGLPVGVVFVLNFAERRRDARQYVIFLLP